MSVELVPVPGDARRFFIRLDGRHAGGGTVHSERGETFSYGVAVAPEMRRRGAAEAGLTLLFEAMRRRGYRRAAVRVRADNAASLALHEKLGFARTGQDGEDVLLEREL